MTGRAALKPVVVTRAEPPDGPLSGELERLGLPVLHWPVLAVEPVDRAQLNQTLRAERPFEWIVFTSAQAVTALADALDGPPAGARVAAVGPATDRALRERGWPIDLTCGGSGAQELVEALASMGPMHGRRILHPASSRALPALPEGLRRLGAEVVTVEAYHTVADRSLDLEACRARIARADIGVVTFASPSAVTELERFLGAEDFGRLLRAAPAAAIGPTTAHALGERGYTAVVAETHTLPGLAQVCYRLAQDRMSSSQAAPRAEKRVKS